MRWLIRSYPRRWRKRYGAELEALLEDSSSGWRGCLDVAVAGLGLRLRTGTPMLAGALLGLGLGMAATYWMTPWQVTSFWVQESGRAFSQVEVGRAVARGLGRAELAKINEKHRLFERERKWQPLEVVIAQFRQAITVDIERGGILVRYAGPHRNNMLAGDLLDLVLKQLLPKDRRGQGT